MAYIMNREGKTYVLCSCDSECKVECGSEEVENALSCFLLRRQGIWCCSQTSRLIVNSQQNGDSSHSVA